MMHDDLTQPIGTITDANQQRASEIQRRLNEVRRQRAQVAAQQEAVNQERQEQVRQRRVLMHERALQATEAKRRRDEIETQQSALSVIAQSQEDETQQRQIQEAGDQRHKEQADARRRVWEEHRQVKEAERLALFRARNLLYQEKRMTLEALKRQNRDERQRLIERLEQTPPVLQEASCAEAAAASIDA